MIDVSVRCDKPYDLDKADKARRKPRRKRKDSHTTAYELTIRLNEEQRELMDGKRKYVRVVYAKNKREDLAAIAHAFEQEVSGMLRDAALLKGQSIMGEADSVSNVVRAYLRSRRASAKPRYLEEGERLTSRYLDPTIGNLPFRDLTVNQVEDAIEAIPEISRKLNTEKREREEAGRAARRAKRKSGADKSATHYPEFKPIRVAGRPMQHRVLSLLRLAGNYAVDKGLADYNVADNKRLKSQYPKSKPKVDNFTEDEAKYIYAKIQELPLSSRKVELQLMFMCGLRPCELLALTFDDINLRNPDQGVLHVVKRLKTANASRNIPLDPATTAMLASWKQSRVEFAEAAGIRFHDSWLVCCEDGQKTVYNTLKQRWWYFLRSIGMEHRRPYANPGFTLSVYSGFLEAAAMPVTSEYLAFLEEEGASPQQSA